MPTSRKSSMLSPATPFRTLWAFSSAQPMAPRKKKPSASSPQLSHGCAPRMPEHSAPSITVPAGEVRNDQHSQRSLEHGLPELRRLPAYRYRRNDLGAPFPRRHRSLRGG